MPKKEKIYCGDQKKLPDGYDRFGTRGECLRKGFGVAMYATQRKKDEKDIKNYINKNFKDFKKIFKTPKEQEAFEKLKKIFNIRKK